MRISPTVATLHQLIDNDPAEFGWRCWYCGTDLVPLGTFEALLCAVPLPDGTFAAVDGARWPEVDHDVPRHYGGTDDLANLIVSCGECNRRKGTMTGGEYLAMLDPETFRLTA